VRAGAREIVRANVANNGPRTTRTITASDQKGEDRAMMSVACMTGEDPRLDLTASYARHQCCPGLVYRPDRDEPEPCSCPHHGMVPGAGRKPAGRGRVVLTLAAFAAFLAFVVVLFR
jgi:hypothetical protein